MMVNDKLIQFTNTQTINLLLTTFLNQIFEPDTIGIFWGQIWNRGTILLRYSISDIEYQPFVFLVLMNTGCES